MKRRAALDETQVIPRKKARIGLTLAQSIEVRKEVNKQLARKTDWKVAAISYIFGAGIGVSNSGEVFSLFNNMTRGDGLLNNFDAASVFPKNISGRFKWVAGDSANVVRLIIFQWFGDIVPVPSGILDASSIGTLGAPLAMWHVENKPLRRILFDETVQLQTDAGQGLDYVQKFFVPQSRLKPVRMGTTAPAMQDGGLYALAITDSGAVTHPALDLHVQTVFKD